MKILLRQKKQKNHRWYKVCFWCCAIIFFAWPDKAWALQTHGAPEGLYVHQMAHILFIMALSYLLWDIRRSSFTSKGWRYLQVFCVLMIIWNIMAFVGHATGVSIREENVSTALGYFHARLLGPISGREIVYYIAKFDHVIAVPALFFLFAGLKALYKSVEKQSGQGDRK